MIGPDEKKVALKFECKLTREAATLSLSSNLTIKAEIYTTNIIKVTFLWYVYMLLSKKLTKNVQVSPKHFISEHLHTKIDKSFTCSISTPSEYEVLFNKLF